MKKIKKEKIGSLYTYVYLALYIILGLGVFVFIGSQIDTLSYQSKIHNCLTHGFYSYSENENACYEYEYNNLVNYEKVIKENMFGSHCNILDDCIKLRNKLK